MKIYKYHKSPDRYKYFGAEKENFSGIGFELEIDCMPLRKIHTKECEEVADLFENVKEHFIFEKDSSLISGFELISQPHTIEEMRNLLPQLKPIFESVKEYGIPNNSLNASLHVHVSRSVYNNNEENLEKIKNYLNFYKKEIKKICPSTAKKIYYTLCKSKYSALNNKHKNTIEFRYFGNTLDVEKLTEVIEFCWEVCSSAATGIVTTTLFGPMPEPEVMENPVTEPEVTTQQE